MKAGGVASKDSQPACRICGGAIRPHNRYGICKRNPECSREARRQSEARRDGEARRERDRRRYAKNRKAIREYSRQYYARNREATCQKIQEYRAKNREAICKRDRDRRAKAALFSCTPREKCHGILAPRWAGGRECFCHHCGKPLGWRTPSQIHESGTFCQKHVNSWKIYQHKEKSDETEKRTQGHL